MSANARALLLTNRYDQAAQAVFARMDVKPSRPRKKLYDRFIRTLKENGVWDRLDVLYLLAAHDAQAARLNLKSGSFDLTVNNSPVFAANQGYTGDASSATLTATGYAPSGGGTLYTLNDACLGLYVRTAATNDGSSHIDLYCGAARMGQRTGTPAQYAGRINDGTSTNAAISSQTGHIMIQRTASNARAVYRNNVSEISDSTTSTSAAASFSIFGTTGNFSDPQVSAAYAGGSLSTAQRGAMHTALAAYLTGVGAI